MTQIEDSVFIRALRRQPVERTPVWIMRQAGRYLSEYRSIRSKVGDFLTLCKTPELACEVTLLPLQKFNLDAAILFSDILMIPEAMGLGLSFVAEEGPKFARVVATAADVAALPNIDPEQDLGFVSAAIRNIKRELGTKTPLIGFAGSPWTVATYMVEGQTSKQFNRVRGLLYEKPEVVQRLLEHLTTQIGNSLLAQIEAGVDVVMLFDTWGGLLSDQMYNKFSLKYMEEIVKLIHISYPSMPIILFSKNGGKCITDIAATGCQAIGLDWTADLAQARKLVGDKVALQGNLDPCVLYAKPEIIFAEVQNVLQQYGKGSGHIFNLGHGILPDINPEHVQAMLEAINKYSPAFHQP